jgi:DNA primase
VRVIRGYDSATDLYELARDLSLIPASQRPVVLQLGDFDPSGEDIARDFKERLKTLSKRDDAIFEKIAVTLDQIISLDLPAKPESLEELAKLKRDPRYKTYIERIRELSEKDERVRKLVEKYGSLEIRVELDALVALKPDEFKKILENSISRYFDEKIYEEITKRREEQLRRWAEEVRRETLENLRKLLNRPTQ